ncbi:hypothetical protein FGG08_003131 [Glutinoglossum americanum]|uniref:Uncharacterized protein n=1 Tax=Glutinoglossum americanum TaxID=1670608 RepID=A0A9P8I7W4_9PEZI|nr:hypothetical protein FGG08_003131 [Glutinoglossum americanum]
MPNKKAKTSACNSSASIPNRKGKRRTSARKPSAGTRNKKAKRRTSTRKPSARTRNKGFKGEKLQFLICLRLNRTPWEEVHSAYEKEFGKASLDAIRTLFYSSEYYKTQRSTVRIVHYIQPTTNDASLHITNDVAAVEPDSITANGGSANPNPMVYDSEDCYLNTAHSTASDPKHTDRHGLDLRPACSGALHTELYPRALGPVSTDPVPSDTGSWTSGWEPFRSGPSSSATLAPPALTPELFCTRLDSECPDLGVLNSEALYPIPFDSESSNWGTPSSEDLDYLSSGISDVQVFSRREISSALLDLRVSDLFDLSTSDAQACGFQGLDSELLDSSIFDAQACGFRGLDSGLLDSNISNVQTYRSQGLDSEQFNLSISGAQAYGLQGFDTALLNTSVPATAITTEYTTECACMPSLAGSEWDYAYKF